MNDLVIGIDLGITGAMTFIEQGNVTHIYDLPTKYTETKARQETIVDGVSFAKMVTFNQSLNIHYFIENTHSMQDSAMTAFSMGQTKGIVRAEIEVLSNGFVHWIQPEEWKKYFGLMKLSKDCSRIKALELYPECYELIKLKKYHNRAESLLIADYGKFLLDKAL
jgi:hypothetical protein